MILRASLRKWAVATVLVLMTGTAMAGSFSSSSRGFSSSSSFSSRSYTAPSRSFSSPSYQAPSRSFSSPSYRSPSVPAYRSPTPYVRPYAYAYRTPSSVYRAPIVQNHYYGGYGYGGSILHNPFFWMWASQPHYYGAGMMMPNGVMAGPGGGYYTAPVVYNPLTSIFLWILALGLIFFVVWLIVAACRAIRD